ncbi:hypothetical protein P22_1081 [Propionispora sp. 2/2-37]|uniref:hypothetical protein n=1 Tax=Propionispora sp. 2/2-37 TaxID=1677858 RepID=UPI0006BB5566|nr:hypothetical protein [Propionispora sp. 2/2-37]CUH95012.1 hypothetical protein P22_1081 [Propionispora sp. 2/2-37]
MQVEVKSTEEKVIDKTIFEMLCVENDVKIVCKSCKGEMGLAQMTPNNSEMRWYRCAQCGKLRLIGKEFETHELSKKVIML